LPLATNMPLGEAHQSSTYNSFTQPQNDRFVVLDARPQKLMNEN